MSTPAFKSHSPLDSLVRRTSARRTHNAGYPVQHTHLTSSLAPLPETPPRHVPQYHQQLSPASPLLHGHFARDSVATTSSSGDNSYLNSTRSSVDSRIVDQELDHRFCDDESIYSDVTGPALRDSWKIAVASSTPMGRRKYAENLEDDTLNSNPTCYSQQQSYPSFSSVPTLIVSSPNDSTEATEHSRAGRMPIMGPTGLNFSRPVRPPLSSTPEDEQQKRRVLERNVRRAPSPSVTQMPGFNDQCQTQDRGTSVSFFTSHANPEERAKSPTPTVGSNGSDITSSSPNRRQIVSPSTLLHQQAPLMSSSPETRQPTAPALPSLPKRPPSLRIGSPVSLYSGYSFYQFDSETPSPTGEFHDRLQTRSTSGQVTQSSPTQQLSFTDVSLPSDTPTPQDYLQQGIQHHEANRLKESAICFEKSAKNNGGCGIGMLMWGLALRHGWGCEKNEKFAFKWLTRAAESAVEDLENARAGGGIDSSAVQVCARRLSCFRTLANLMSSADRTGPCYI